MDKIQAMSTFVAVVGAGSFMKTMSVLGISKAAVSRHVAELEQHLETRLLQRTTRRLSLTTERYFFLALKQKVPPMLPIPPNLYKLTVMEALCYTTK